MLTRGRTPIYSDPDGDYKLCACGERFPCEYGRRGQLTSRRDCDACRVRKARRLAADLPNIPANAPRCADCQALVGLVYGSTVTHLDAHGRCVSCARWHLKVLARAASQQPVSSPTTAATLAKVAEAMPSAVPAQNQPVAPQMADPRITSLRTRLDVNDKEAQQLLTWAKKGVPA